ncbi:amyloid fiber anchoring/assembly protein TapA [Fictibacillus aquaticus]|uniref:Amyloid fiber anchoring/assembly protein TapA n=1 Tax=Fictibacillus aquaticus TaxID=2021314 RepID=A0A235F8Y0_9BACL|nr:amyloid fiber anchoring/assembly protein TapA [Fictibacillus aquaticus]OYD57544.1 amyloid fiber anchoring/assembly protein TapA [Fictibacillus aquaticus]
MLTVKLCMIFYTMLFCLSYLSGATGAYFNDRANLSIPIKAGTWDTTLGWDKSSLKFGAVSMNSEGCAPVTAIIKNKSENDMKGPVAYEVWWAASGNPMNGEKVATGEVPALKSMTQTTLTFTPVNDGVYKFKAYQRPGHPGQGVLWSDSITASKCSLPPLAPEKTPEAPVKTEPQQPAQQPAAPTAPVTPQPEAEKEKADEEKTPAPAPAPQPEVDAPQPAEPAKTNEAPAPEPSAEK